MPEDTACQGGRRQESRVFAGPGYIRTMALRQPPARTPQQRENSLKKANSTRSQRADDKKRIAARELDARTIIAAPPAHWQKAKVADLLLALPGVGETK